MGYLITVAFITIYCLGLYYWDKKVNWSLNLKASRTIKHIHYAGLMICITLTILYSNFSIGLRGLWTTRSIIFVTLLTGLFLMLIADKNALKKYERWYFRIFSILPVLTAGFMLIPFLGIVMVISLFGRLADPATEIFFEDEKLRVQSTFIGVLGPPRLDIIEKNGLFEKHIKRIDYWATEIDSISISYDIDSTRVFGYQLFGFEEERNEKPMVIGLKKIK